MAEGYIINYGTALEITKREKQIQRTIAFLEFDAPRVTLVRGGKSNTGKIKTVFWIMPKGAKKPSP